MSESRRILVIEDDADLRRLLTLHLSDLGMQVRQASDGLTGLDLAMTTAPELIILDLKLPGMDGLEVCRRVRQTQEYIPILMLTSRSSETDRVVGLEVGADDYLTKPFSVQELLARVKAMFRRGDAMAAPKKAETQEIMEFGDLRIETSKRRVTLRGEPVSLTVKEFDLLALFAQEPGRVYTRENLLDGVWGPGYHGYEHTVNTHINRLRGKIEDDPAKPRYLQTIWGVGYRLAEETAA
ncbi:response regulator transcription factor [bacterium]|nr:MAG: response regulator transcription factor [bacterium]